MNHADFRAEWDEAPEPEADRNVTHMFQIRSGWNDHVMYAHNNIVKTKPATKTVKTEMEGWWFMNGTNGAIVNLASNEAKVLTLAQNGSVILGDFNAHGQTEEPQLFWLQPESETITTSINGQWAAQSCLFMPK